MLIQANSSLVINPDTIVGARLEEAGGELRWRVVYIGQTENSPTIFLTVEELDHILNEVEVPKMAAILRAAGSGQRSTKYKRPDNGQQETHR